jgi:hypothetical protein
MLIPLPTFYRNTLPPSSEPNTQAAGSSATSSNKLQGAAEIMN